MAVRGDIYHHKQLVFHNGFAGKKYLILLNSPSKKDPHLFVKTTSQKKDKPVIPGCIEERSLFFIPIGTTFFPKETWIQLYEIYPIPREDMKKSHEIDFVGTLDSKLIDDIIDCLFLTQGDDIIDQYEKLLRPPMQKSLQKLLEKFGKKH